MPTKAREITCEDKSRTDVSKSSSGSYLVPVRLLQFPAVRCLGAWVRLVSVVTKIDMGVNGHAHGARKRPSNYAPGSKKLSGIFLVAEGEIVFY